MCEHTAKRFIAVVAILVLSLGCKEQVKNCGTDPKAFRILEEGPYFVPGKYGELKISIQAIDISNGRGRIFIHKSISRIETTYVSNDHGRSWQKIDGSKCTQISSRLGIPRTNCIISKANINVRYRLKQDAESDEFELSKDAGRTWTTLNSKFEGLQAAKIEELIDTGFYQQGRVFARIVSDGDVRNFVVSDDYGATFRETDMLPFECRGSRQRLFKRDSLDPDRALSVSNDNGKSWSILPGAEVLFAPLYRNRRKGALMTTRRVNKDDEEVMAYFAYAVKQIECDPERSEVFYVLNDLKGIFRTKDNGKTFTVLPLGDKRYLDIGEIAADPIDSGVLYATHGRDKIYRSDDYGCSWNLLTIPGE